MEIKEHVHTTNEEISVNDILDYMKMSGIATFQRKAGRYAIACDVIKNEDPQFHTPKMDYLLQVIEFKEMKENIEDSTLFTELLFDNNFKVKECGFQFGMPEDEKFVCVSNSSLSDDIFYVEELVDELLEKFRTNAMIR